MSRNGPLALAYHTLFVVFMLAPILVVCIVAFTPEGYLSFPTDRWSLRWFYAIGRYPEFISAFWRSIWDYSGMHSPTPHTVPSPKGTRRAEGRTGAPSR